MYCNEIEKVENYELAKADNFKGWECHHHLETHNSDGERRLVQISVEELIALDMYYNRPPEELVFLLKSEHAALHGSFRTSNFGGGWEKGKPRAEDTKKKISETLKGKPSYIRTEETKRKMSEVRKGKPSRLKGTTRPWKGKHWKIVEGKRVWY